MELLLRREQTEGLFGGAKFNLTAKARLTEEEEGYVGKYKMNGVLLYDEMPTDLQNASLGSLFVGRFLKLKVTVGELIEGKDIECKDIIEIMAVESQIRDACARFHKILMTAGHFGGEEVIEYK